MLPLQLSPEEFRRLADRVSDAATWSVWPGEPIPALVVRDCLE